MTWGPDGSLYIVSEGDKAIYRLRDPLHGNLETFVSNVPASPNGLTFGPDGNLYVLTSNRVYKYNGSTGAYMGIFVSGLSDGKQGIGFGPDGNLYVNDEHGDRVLRFDGSTGAYLNVYATVPSGQGARVFHWKDGYFYLGASFWDGDKIYRFRDNGSTATNRQVFIEGVVGGNHRLRHPTGFRFGPDGNLYVASMRTNNVQKYAPYPSSNGSNYLGDYISLGWPKDIVFFYVADSTPTPTPTPEPVVTPSGGTPGGLVAEYRFDTCGDHHYPYTGDHTGTLPDGVLRGHATITADGDGKIYRAYEGDGSNGTQMTVADHDNGTPNDPSDDTLTNPALDILGDLTLSAWVYPYGYPGWVEIIVSRSHEGEFWFGRDSNGYLVYAHNSGDMVTSSARVPANEWHHVTLVRTGTSGNFTLKFYVDGVLQDTKTYNRSIQATDHVLEIGSCQFVCGGLNFNGKIDEVKIYNTALSDGEIAQMYSNENNGQNADGSQRCSGWCEPGALSVLQNGSFEDSSPGSSPAGWSGGEATDSSSVNPKPDGNQYAFTWPGDLLYQDVPISPNGVYTVTFYAGSHQPEDGDKTVSVRYLDSNYQPLGSPVVHVITKDVDTDHLLSQMRTLHAGSAPANASYLRIAVDAGSSDYAKIDAVCLYGPEPPQASLGDFVWNDVDADGIQDAGEAGISNVTVELYNGDSCSGSAVATTTTDGSGHYSFTDLAPGIYSVKFVKPNGYAFSPVNQGSDDSVDSDADTSTGCTGGIDLSSGENDTSWDAGMYQPTPHLLIDKDTSTPTTVAGGEATYTIVVRNDGTGVARGVVITDTLPNGFTYNRTISVDTSGPVTRTEIITPVNTLLNHTGYIYAFGGKNTPNFWRYDLQTGTWQVMADAPGNVHAGGDIAMANGHIFGMGGGSTNAFWRYDPSSNTWDDGAAADVPLPPGKEVGTGGALTYDDRYVYAIVGGNDSSTDNDLWRYDPRTDTWTLLTHTPVAQSGGSDITYGDGYIYFLGGNNGNDDPSQWGPENPGYEFYRYNIQTDTWERLHDLPNVEPAKEGAAIVFHPGTVSGNQPSSGSIYAWVGGDKQLYYRYDIATNTWANETNVEEDVDTSDIDKSIITNGQDTNPGVINIFNNPVNNPSNEIPFINTITINKSKYKFLSVFFSLNSSNFLFILGINAT